MISRRSKKKHGKKVKTILLLKSSFPFVIVQDILTKPAEEFGNDDMLEELWAKRAFDHAELYFNLLCSVNFLNIFIINKSRSQ